MGIQKFSEVFSRAFIPVKSLADIVKGKSIALDMHLLLYKSIKAIGHVTLTDSSGIPTSGINNLLNLIPKLKKSGVTRIIAVFDNPEGGSPLKGDTCKKRTAQGEDCKQRAESEDNELLKAKLENRAWTMDSSVINDAKQLLLLLGVEAHDAPRGFEAEHYAAFLASTGVVDMVMSDDSDTVMFGSPKTIFPRTIRVGNTTYKYAIVDLVFLLTEYSITRDELVHVCLALGSDFASKTPKVGPVTALTRGKNLPLSDDQKAAYGYIVSPPAGTVNAYPGKMNLIEAASWLSQMKGFNYSRVAKILGISPELSTKPDIPHS